MAETSGKTYTLEECKQHTSEKSCWLVIHGQVYDVTSFLEEHPGGYDILLTATGRDATQDFEEIGHSNSAREYLKKYLIGPYAGGDSAPSAGPKAASQSAAQKEVSSLSRAFSVLLPVILLLVAVAVGMSFGKK